MTAGLGICSVSSISARFKRLERRMAQPTKTTTCDLAECWLALPLAAWRDTYATLHMWPQMAGKVRLALTPLLNHWWNVPWPWRRRASPLSAT
jgi:hypothetical protein